jgi:competence protein ComGC
MGGFVRKLIKRPDVQKAFKQVKEKKKEAVKKVVETKEDTTSAIKRKGRRSTIKTSASGLNETEIKKKSLLG